MLLMQTRAIVLAFSCAASSLTLTAASCMCVPQQAPEQSEVDAKESSSGAEANKMSPTRKIAGGPEVEPFESSKPGLTGLGKRFLEDQRQIWTSPAKVRFSDVQWLVPASGITAASLVTHRAFYAVDFSKTITHSH